MAAIATCEQPLREMCLKESAREREFYRYYEPIKAWTAKGPTFCDVGNQAANLAHAPTSSPDPALTAFCQLGALRVGTRRAMLFFFDQTYAYVLAEATQSLSLLDESVVGVEDGIWLGHAKIPRGYSVCESTTLHLQPQPDPQNGTTRDHGLVHIIKDLSEDVNFCNLPFVRDGPKARFYAGVPIRTQRGINIGAYCLLDDTPRHGLTESEMKFLQHMGKTVMNHLEMVRSKAQHERATKMVAGIGSFVYGASEVDGDASGESNSTLYGSPRSGHSRHASLRNGASSPRAKSTNPTPPATRTRSDDLRTNKERSGHSPRASPTSTPVQTSEGGEPVGSTQTDTARDRHPSDVSRGGHRTLDPKIESESLIVQNTFERAATVLRSALGVDGAMFVDVNISSYSESIPSVASVAGQSQQNYSDSAHSSADESRVDLDRSHSIHKSSDGGGTASCQVLACDHGDDGRFGQVEPAMRINERFLRKLLRRYPKGTIWNFTTDGVSSSDDDSMSGALSPLAHPHITQKKNRKVSRLEDGKRLAQHFPGVRSLAIRGIWNEITGRWHAAAIVWTYNAFQSLTPELDAPFLQAFCDVLMAEVHRLEAQQSDRAKVDFISSISHELRSPLHGILGSVECIQEQRTDEYTTSLASQIEACGRTLLDIVNNLLDFTKINYYGGNPDKEPSSEGTHRPKHPQMAGSEGQLGSVMSLAADIPLDVVTEEVVGTAFYSFCHSRDKSFVLNHKVVVTVDIERGADINWWCHIVRGSWKRIIINLVGNALKYTSEGCIQVSLQRRPSQKRRKFDAVLTVKDSGQGMSQNFLQHGLFKAFAQENSFVDGTGLGMSLVAKIVKSMGGKIEVQSEEAVGTTVVLQIPMEEAQRRGDSDSDDAGAVELEIPSGLTVALLSPTGCGPNDTAESKLVAIPPQVTEIAGIVKVCSALGLRTVSMDRHNVQDTDFLLCTEDQILQSPETSDRNPSPGSPLNDDIVGRIAAGRPLIIVCRNPIRLRNFRQCHADLLSSGDVKLISQPVGPERLLSTIRDCLSGSAEKQSVDLQGCLPQRPFLQDLQPIRDESEMVLVSPNRTLDLTSTDQRRPSAPNIGIDIDDTVLVTPKTTAAHLQLGNTAKPTSRAFHFPLSRSAPESNIASPATTNDAPRPPITTPLPASSGLTLLLVDDNPINLRLLTIYANKQNHAHICAHNGAHAVKAYEAACTGLPLPPHLIAIQTQATPSTLAPARPGVVLMDINMPVLNGFEATRQIRELERSMDLPPTMIIALTGLGSARAMEEAQACGVDLFLTKPVRLKELGRILDGVSRVR